MKSIKLNNFGHTPHARFSKQYAIETIYPVSKRSCYDRNQLNLNDAVNDGLECLCCRFWYGDETIFPHVEFMYNQQFSEQITS